MNVSIIMPLTTFSCRLVIIFETQGGVKSYYKPGKALISKQMSVLNCSCDIKH